MASKYYFYCEQTNAHSSDVTCICLSKTGLIVSGSGDKTVKYWNVSNQNGCDDDRALNLSKTITDHKYSVNAVSLSPGGTLLCSASTDGTSRLWDARTGSELASLVQPSGAAVRTAAFCPGASVLASAGDDEAVCLWDLSSGHLVRTIRDHEATVFSIAFSPDGDILVTSDAFGRVKVWSALISHSQILTSTEEAHDLGVNCICFSPIFTKGVLTTEYHLMTCGNDGFVSRWNIQTGNVKEIRLVTRRRAHDGSAMAVSVSPDGSTVVTGGGDKVIKTWSQFLEPCQCLEGHSRYVTSLSFSPCGQILVSGSNDKSIRVWARSDTEHISFQNSSGNNDSRADNRYQVQLSKSKTRHLGTLAGHSLDVTSIDARDSVIVSGCADSLVRVWRRSESEEKYFELDISPLAGHSYAVYCVRLDAGGERLVSAGLDGCVILWSLSSGDIIQNWIHPEKLAFRVVTLSSDCAEIAAGGDDNNIYRWSVGQADWTERILRWHDSTVQALAFSPASDLLASGCSGGALSIWSSHSFAPLMTHVDGHDLGVTGMQFMKDGSLVTVGNDGEIKIWSVHLTEDLRCEAVVRAHHTSILSLWISDDQEILVTGSGDKTCKVWRVSSLACVATLGPHETYVTGAAGDRLTGALAAGVGRSIVLYRLPASDPVTSARGHDITLWSAVDVTHWLGTLGLSETGEKLCNVDGAQLRQLSIDELIILGIDEEIAGKIWSETQLMCDGSGEIPSEFVCPITCDIMTSPVRCCDGFVYEECAIKEWLMTRRNTSPMTNLEMNNTDFQPCKELKSRIEAFKSSC